MRRFTDQTTSHYLGLNELMPSKGIWSACIMEHQYSQPHIKCCHSFPPGSLHVQWAFESFSKGMSLLNWYKIVCMGKLSYAYIWIKSMHMFFKFDLGFPDFFIWGSVVVFNLEPYCLYVCIYQGWPQTLVEIYRNMVICDIFNNSCQGKYIQVLCH